MRKLLFGIVLAFLTTTISPAIRPSGVLHPAVQMQPDAASAAAPQGVTKDNNQGASPADNPQVLPNGTSQTAPPTDNPEFRIKEFKQEDSPTDNPKEETKENKQESATASESENPADTEAKDQKQSSPKSQKKESSAEGFKINVDVSLVTTDVTIIGQVPSDLSAEDFVIYDDGVAQPASYFSLDQLPLAIGLLIDASESIRPFMPVLQISGISALRRLKPEDQVTLYSFNLNPKRLVDLTDDRVKIADEIDKIKIAFSTNINDSLYNAANYLSNKAPNNRRAIILISDNARRGDSRHNASRARIELLENAVTLLNIRAQESLDFYDAEWALSDREIMQTVDETGGEQFRVNAASSLQQALADAIIKLRKQYTLGFYPPAHAKAGVFHKLTIKFAKESRCPGCRVRSRSGYYPGVTAPNPPPLTAKNKKTPVRTPEKVDEMLIQRSIRSAGTVDLDLPGIAFAVDTKPKTDEKGNPALKLDIKIRFDRIGFTPKDNRHKCNVRVAIFYGTEKGKILGSSGGKIDWALSNENYQQVMKEGYSFSTDVPLKGEKQLMKVVVYDETTDRVGSQTVLYTAPS
jgi:Ca-activated chloride channel homolog